jgi:hypothetical protein
MTIIAAAEAAIETVAEGKRILRKLLKVQRRYASYFTMQNIDKFICTSAGTLNGLVLINYNELRPY